YTLLLCVPPWALATIVAIFLSRNRWIFTRHVIKYCLMAQSYGGFICFLAWASGSISQPPAKGAVALALINTISSFGNIFGSYAWPSAWGPSYNLSFAISILAGAIGLIMCWYFRRQLKLLNAMDSGRGYRYML
ncbi:hypothetical protein MPER_12204, partial [Moniliophthora perniciosa FA553]